MSALRNHKFLLIVIAVLVIIKFLLLPVFSWQNEQLKSINRQNSQLVKGLGLLKNKQELLSKLQKLQKNNQVKLSAAARNDDSAINYQLIIQKQVEVLLEKYQLNSRTVTWLNTSVNGNIEKHRLEISLSGTVKHFIQFMSEIEQIKPKLVLTEYRSTINHMYPKSHRLGRFSGKFIIVGWRNTAGGANEK